MAYNNYIYPVGYNPYQSTYMQPYQQMVPQNMVQPTQMSVSNQPVQTSNSIIWVSGEKEAAMYPIAPNNAVTLWSQSEPVVYLKQADASGKPTMKTFDLVERAETPSDGGSSGGAKTAEYATKEELSAVLSAVRGIDGVVASVKSDLETVKGDMYGVIGKKKPTKREEAVTDG